ncbi:MAG: hypothetical protein COA94_01285 [Rickettsiales bacterium]|nr:MAG: hypothetical protein COA94_01285 [Rickettsiales bacterium]
MHNIKQKFLKYIFSFVCFAFLGSCSQTGDYFKAGNAADIAILLPMSGVEAEMGMEYAKMIKMGIKDSAASKIKVTIYDSANQEALEDSLDKILNRGTDIIIGPIYSGPTKIVAEKAGSKGIITISFSNNPTLAEQNLFIYGHAPMRQLEQITNYFLDNGHKNYIALLPSGKHSNVVSKILREMIIDGDGILSRLELYGASPEDIKSSVKIVSETASQLNESDLNLTQPVILIADDPVTLEMVYANIRKYGLDKKAIIAGDSRINIDSPFNTNISFTGTLGVANEKLAARARKAGVRHISFMHALAYDAGKMTGKYIGKRYNKEEFLTRMNSKEEFIGIAGRIHFIDSIAQRKYDVIRKENGIYVGDVKRGYGRSSPVHSR